MSRALQVVLRRESARKLNVDSIKKTLEGFTSRILTEGRVKNGWKVQPPEVDLVSDENKGKEDVKHHYTATLVVRNVPKRSRKPEVFQKELDHVKDVVKRRCNRTDWELAFREVEVEETVQVTKHLYETAVPKVLKPESDKADNEAVDPGEVVDQTVVEAVGEAVAATV